MVKKISITLVGAGMGNPGCLTREVKERIDTADMVFGAARLSGPMSDANTQTVVDTYRVNDMIEALDRLIESGDKPELAAVFIYSGDSGFYSGAEKAYLALWKWAGAVRKEHPELQVGIDIMPGISSVSYLAARLKVSWQDAEILSLHGRDFEETLPLVRDAVRYNDKTFVLLSGAEDVRRLIKNLKDFRDAELFLGYRLSYDDEKLLRVGAGEELSDIEEGLYTAFIRNYAPNRKQLSYGIPTEEYLREDGVPITKEEIREIVLSKLRLFKGCTFYDIGSGTGGVTIDVARISPEIKVFAIEKKAERINLLRRNMDKFGLRNIYPVVGDAGVVLDEVMKKNPPDRVFIGGTEGRLRDIIDLLRKYNKNIRICLTAITLETKDQIMKLLDEEYISKPDIVEVSISRLTKLGGQHMMKKENDIMVAAFDLTGGE
ncbi:MAG: precorrin-6Y C5,15-methyltransferase (decarboxylating) subunit CbiT [Eubacterium sp.]|nr:precorrin-6Y C5,15-methyltransferase (decarboxylating) subunit CbiT [Eubacterium sp.]